MFKKICQTPAKNEIRLPKKSTAYKAMETLFKLPKEIIREISSYLGINEDIISFSTTSKDLQALAFSGERNLTLSRKVPIFMRNYLASQDWSCLRKLIVSGIKFSDPKEKLLHDKLTALSKLHSLRVLELSFPDNQPTGPILDQALKMTWLESLLFDYGFEGDVGDLLASHTRLTAIELMDPVSGIEKMTQLKCLTLPADDTDETMMKVLELTNLTSLDISQTYITNDTLQYITKLTNLKKLNTVGTDAPADWKVLATLPNLYAYKDRVNSRADNRWQFLPLFTRLTKLAIRPLGTFPISIENLLGLTNLRKLDLTSSLPPGSVEFSRLTNLTSLTVLLRTDVEQLLLPPRLKRLALWDFLPKFSNAKSLFASLALATTLQHLDLGTDQQYKHDAELMPEWLVKLTNLQSIILRSTPNEEFCRSLLHMPCLRKLTIYEAPPPNCVAVLKQVDQLVELWLLSHLNPTEIQYLKDHVPYAVYLIP